MTAAEKAKELIEKFRAYSMTYFSEVEGTFDEESEIKNAKQCALIAVEEIINLLDEIYTRETEIAVQFYQQVKEEILKHQ